jgi:hypothetical protein
MAKAGSIKNSVLSKVQGPKIAMVDVGRWNR